MSRLYRFCAVAFVVLIPISAWREKWIGIAAGVLLADVQA